MLSLNTIRAENVSLNKLNIPVFLKWRGLYLGVITSCTFVINYDGVRLCLRTAATNGPIVHPPGDMWAWRAMVMMMPAGDNSWVVHQSSLAVLPAETSGESRRKGRQSENFAYQYLKYLKGYLTCRKTLRHVTPGFTYRPKEGVLWILIALKNQSPLPGLNPRPLGPVASTLTTIPPRRHVCYYKAVLT
jgi:hypothetical protein